MRANHLLLMVFLLWNLCSFSFSLSAKITDTKDIELAAKGRGSEDQRSLLPVRAWVENQKVYVTFADVPSVATVTIANLNSGEQLVETYVSPTTVCIPVASATAPYTITICYGDLLFSGEFTCED